jgi:hypothetical protein
MKYVITESRLENLIFNWLDTQYGDLNKFKHPSYEEVFLERNGMFKMAYINRTKRLYVKNEIWDFIKNVFSLDNDEVGDLLVKWGNNKFGFRVKVAHRVEEV